MQKRPILVCCSVLITLSLLLPATSAAFTLPTMTLVKPSVHREAPTSSQYWAVIFAVGVYANHPDENRPEMIDAANNLRSTLLASSNWQADHILETTGVAATGRALIQDLIWLAQNSKAGDYALVYITTHGCKLHNLRGLPLDLPPKDDADGADRALLMYNGFDNPFACVWDDLLNFFLSRIQCQGLCLIVDSCYSGGFIDTPMRAQNRITLMSCQANEFSYGTDFSDYLISGLQGWADFFGNHDGINSAEEAFAYAQFWVELQDYQHPTMLDNYPGEFPITFNH